MIKASIIGATGYVGAELARLLHSHNKADLVCLASRSYSNKKFGSLYPGHPCQDYILNDINLKEIASASDVIFAALPHGISCDTVLKLNDYNVKIIDLSGDFRYDNPSTYEEWYNIKHPSYDLMKSAVYGLSEIYRKEIADAKIVANPGCYTTCAILSLYPLLENKLIETSPIIVDAKSGVTGAGRNINQSLHFCEVDESFKAYKITHHRHTSEIEQEVSKAAGENIQIDFTPHLLPIKRGILETIYTKIKSGVTEKQIRDAYSKYNNEKFITILESDNIPEIKNVTGSNSFVSGYKINERTNSLIIVSVIDNLIKGAAGQAIQNMNIMFNLDEETGLNIGGWYL